MNPLIKMLIEKNKIPFIDSNVVLNESHKLLAIEDAKRVVAEPSGASGPSGASITKIDGGAPTPVSGESLMKVFVKMLKILNENKK